MTFDQLATQHGRDDTQSPSWLPGDYDGLEEGYGVDLFQVTEEDLARLKSGEIMNLAGSASEYGMYVRLKRPFKPTEAAPDA